MDRISKAKMEKINLPTIRFPPGILRPRLWRPETALARAICSAVRQQRVDATRASDVSTPAQISALFRSKIPPSAGRLGSSRSISHIEAEACAAGQGGVVDHRGGVRDSVDRDAACVGCGRSVARGFHDG